MFQEYRRSARLLLAVATALVLLLGILNTARADCCGTSGNMDRLMAMDTRGVLYVAECCRGAVYAEYADGNVARIAANLGRIGGLAVDRQRVVYVSAPDLGAVYRVLPGGEPELVASDLPMPGALVLDRDGTLMVDTEDQGVVRIGIGR